MDQIRCALCDEQIELPQNEIDAIRAMRAQGYSPKVWHGECFYSLTEDVADEALSNRVELEMLGR